MTQKVLPRPPMSSEVVDNTGHYTQPWRQWNEDLYYSLGTAVFQKITVAQPVRLDARYASLDTTAGAFAITLDAPTVATSRLMIEMVVRGGTNNATMSLTNVVGASASTTCTWNSVGDFIILESSSNKWGMIKEFGVSVT